MLMKNNRIHIWKKAVLFGIVVIAGIVVNPVAAKAVEIDFQTKIVELQNKYPNGKYWNHVGMSSDNSDGYTDKPCTLHKSSNVSHTYGTNGCTCNHFGDKGHLMATQCMGFANKLGHDVFGDTTWIKYNNPTSVQIAGIKPGDIVRLNNNSHSVFVISNNGNILTVGEANYPNGCQIRWNGTYSLLSNSITYYEHAANYDMVLNPDLPAAPSVSTEQLATDAKTEDDRTQPVTEAKTEVTTEKKAFTGWKKASDGVNYQYFKSDKLQKSKWITISGKKYYLDKKGYRVTGLYKIGSKQYYFNSKGVLQKEKWVSYEGSDYYVGPSGYIWKNQWLYKKGTRVYVKKDGAMAKNELVKISSKTYYFNGSGKRSKGFKKAGDKCYYCDKSGVVQKKKWIKMGNKSYYVQKNGVRVENKLIKIGRYQYYFNGKGVMQKNKKITLGNKVYKADGKGHCKLFCVVEPIDKPEKKEDEGNTTEAVTEKTEKNTTESYTSKE